jgi:hypothetical protein
LRKLGQQLLGPQCGQRLRASISRTTSAAGVS